jgi:MSHA pilin protein MshD
MQRGVTLVELILSIVIIGVGLAGIVMVISRNVLSSADPMIQDQTVAIAEAYLEEILAKDFCDPNNAVACSPGNAPGSANCNVCPAREASRDLYDNVCDYNILPDTVVRDQTGTAIASLSTYTAQVGVTANGAALNGLAGASCQVLRVDVTVTGPGGTTYTLTDYRANY